MMKILKDTNDAAFEGLDILNPYISKMHEKNIEIATVLLDSGYTQKEIQDFINVSTPQFEEWIDFEIEIRKRIAEA